VSSKPWRCCQCDPVRTVIPLVSLYHLLCSSLHRTKLITFIKFTSFTISIIVSYLNCSAQASIARGLAYAPYADMLWMETSTPDLGEAQQFADAIHAKFPGKLLAYNCSPSFNWKSHLDDATIAEFQARAAAPGGRRWVQLCPSLAGKLGVVLPTGRRFWGCSSVPQARCQRVWTSNQVKAFRCCRDGPCLLRVTPLRPAPWMGILLAAEPGRGPGGV